MSKEKKPGYSEFAFLLATSLVICSILIATYAGFIKSKPNVDYTTLWFTVMALLFSTLVFLFFSIKGRREEYRKRKQAEYFVTYYLKLSKVYSQHIENSTVSLFVDKVEKNPFDYKEFLSSLDDQTKETIKEYCLIKEAQLREAIVKIALDSDKDSTEISKGPPLLQKYEHIRQYCRIIRATKDIPYYC